MLITQIYILQGFKQLIDLKPEFPDLHIEGNPFYDIFPIEPIRC